MKLKTTSQRLPADSCQPASSADKLSAKKGFTLIELLLVIAMIAVLASAILVSISGQRDRARVSKVILELSGVIQPMMMCWSDGKTPNLLGWGDSQICGVDGYGSVPVSPGAGWSFDRGNLTGTATSGNWYFGAYTSESRVCCNSTYNKCGVSLTPAISCEVNTQLQ